MLSFLGAERRLYPIAHPTNGVFINKTLGQSIKVHGLSIKDPNSVERALIPKSDNEFYVECLPVVLRFIGQNKIVVSGEQICERWTTLGTQFIRT